VKERLSCDYRNFSLALAGEFFYLYADKETILSKTFYPLKSTHLKLNVSFCIFLLIAEIAFAQKKNPTIYPYGGTQDNSRKAYGMSKTPLNFTSLADFRGAQFDSLADFRDAKFGSLVYFGGAQFNSGITFRGARFDKSGLVEFSLTTIRDTVRIGNMGSADIQNYDFLRAKLLPASKHVIAADTAKNIPGKIIQYPGAKILISGPVNLKIQLEKFKFITIVDTLNYFAKKDIISTLRDISFAGDRFKTERFELDYTFAKLTLHQKESVNFEEYAALNPITWGRFLYNATMGLGYRPFRWVWWILVIVISYSIFFILKMPERINQYIGKEDEQNKNPRRKSSAKPKPTPISETIINSFYFSAMVLFTFRLKRDILTFFNANEKRIIVSEWLLGFLIYLAFLTLAKSGSILHTLKNLFLG